ncbi:hypothetical protein N3Z17_04790 [Candidatus Bandiella numerosa]|uniref:hypothetical protein n=1 Tax=Candidatus Bandiella numerosa TaxID=2570586 RepID=UPI00249DA10A|nr:hypothetical protein [Candidatus Bandiella numerosa]WHA04540.1 hypothetical protein N3Z17_04790 [Candidatus Bandiella numerosa]
MIKQAKKYLVIAVLTTGMGSLVGCSTASKMIKHGNLEVETKMSGAPREARKEQSVEIRSMQRLTTNIEPTITL